MYQEHFPGRSLALASPRPGSAPHGSLPRACFRVPVGPPARPQLLWLRLTSLRCPFTARSSHSGATAHLDGVSCRAPGASAAEPAERGGEREGGRRPAASAGPPPTSPRPAGFPDVNRAALQEHSNSAECVI